MTKEEINSPDSSNKADEQVGNKANVYEIGYLLVSSVSKEEALDEVTKMKSLLEDNKALFLSGEEPELIDLAYPMSKTVDANKKIYEDAHFGWIKFEAETEVLADIKKGLDNQISILRYLLIKTTAKDNLLADSSKLVIAKKDLVDKAKVVEPIKIVEKDSQEDVISAEPERTEEEKKELDDTIDNLII